MRRQSIPSPIGFSDGEIESYRKVGDVLEVIVKAWNEQRLRLTFYSVVRMLDNLAGDISDFCEMGEQTDFLQAALDSVYEIVPSETPYKHFQFVNLNDQAALEVVAEQVTISTSVAE